MNLPKNTIDPPSHEAVEAFFDTVASVSDEARRVLYAMSACQTFEAVAKCTGTGMLEIPGIIAGVAKCRPRDELVEFDVRSKSFGFKKAGHADAFATVQRFVAEFGKWARDPDVSKKLGEAEGHRVSMADARRAAA